MSWKLNYIEKRLMQIKKKQGLIFGTRGLVISARKDFTLLLESNSYQICKGTPLETRDNCLAGKTHRVAFHTYTPSRRSNVIDLIHIDGCTMQTRTLGGALYFVTFIDDHSGKVWAFALKSKD